MAIFKEYIYILIVFSILKIDAQQFNIQNLNIENGLPSNYINDIQQDYIGYLWIATEKGLIKFDGDNILQINKLKTNSLFIDDNNTIYTGTKNGLFVKNKSKEEFYKSKEIIKIFKHNDNVFIGTVEGVFNFDNNELVPLRINSTIDYSKINDIYFHNNSYFIASSNGLFKIYKNFKNSSLKKISKENYISIIGFKDKIYTASFNGELSIIKNETIIKVAKSLDELSSIKKIKNEIWVSSKTNGIEIFTLPSFSFKQKINKYNSLITNSINSIFISRNQSIIIGSSKGMYLLENNYTKKETKPEIYFENFLVNYKPIDSLLPENRIILSHWENNIAITFKTVHTLNPKKIQYRYKLGENFSPWSSNNNVQFPNLNPGTYSFKVQSKIGTIHSDIKSFNFTIDTPFYKKAWFNFIVAISLLIGSYISLHYYIKGINNKNKKKVDNLKLQNRILTLEQKALQLQMNPHFIFNVLNGIKALGNSGKTNELNKTISKFSVLLRGILNNSRKEEITLKEEIQILKNYIELEQRMSSKPFTYTINEQLNNIDNEEILIPTMLIQPFVENCIEHAFQNKTNGNIIINLSIKHSFLNFSISDNGIGIDRSKKRKKNTNHKSIALKVSKERLDIISPTNSFKIKEISEQGIITGTTVSFKIPLKTDY